jgi:type VI protein secretion system component Hcp
MPLDGFMYLKGGARTPIHGETLDEKFTDKDAFSINSFELSSPTAGFGSVSEDLAGTGDEGDEAHGGSLGSGENDSTGSSTQVQTDHKDKTRKGKKHKRRWTFEITKDLDIATPLLFRAYCEHAQEEDPKPYTAKLVLRKAGGKWSFTYLELTFYEVQVISFEIKSESDKLPKESVSFSFNKCKFRYSAQKPDGGSKPNEKTFDWRNI